MGPPGESAPDVTYDLWRLQRLARDTDGRVDTLERQVAALERRVTTGGCTTGLTRVVTGVRIEYLFDEPYAHVDTTLICAGRF